MTRHERRSCPSPGRATCTSYSPGASVNTSGVDARGGGVDPLAVARDHGDHLAPGRGVDDHAAARRRGHLELWRRGPERDGRDRRLLRLDSSVATTARAQHGPDQDAGAESSQPAQPRRSTTIAGPARGERGSVGAITAGSAFGGCTTAAGGAVAAGAGAGGGGVRGGARSRLAAAAASRSGRPDVDGLRGGRRRGRRHRTGGGRRWRRAGGKAGQQRAGRSASHREMAPASENRRRRAGRDGRRRSRRRHGDRRDRPRTAATDRGATSSSLRPAERSAAARRGTSRSGASSAASSSACTRDRSAITSPNVE